MSIDLRWGAGGYSISPSLSCDRVVSSRSPIFQLIQEYSYDVYFSKGSSSTRRMDDLIHDIGQLYQDGKASAYDVDEEGNNIVHVSHLTCYGAVWFIKLHAARKLHKWIISAWVMMMQWKRFV